MNYTTLDTPKYKILGNLRNSLFIGTVHKSNKVGKIKACSQHKNQFALYFDDEQDANIFLNVYFNMNKVNPKNEKFYEVRLATQVPTDYPLDKQAELFGIKCWYSSKALQEYIDNPDDFILHVD